MTQVETIIGRIGRPHGLRGEVTVVVITDEPDQRFRVGSVLGCQASTDTFTVTGCRWHKGVLLVSLAGVDDRTAAETLRGTVLTALVSMAETPSDPGEYYDRQLIGLTACSVEGEALGTVTAVSHLPSQDLLVISHNGSQSLVPFVAALVPDVDLAAGTCTIATIPGLLDDEAVEAR